MHTKGNLFIISGPSGAGKGTLVDAVVKRLDNIVVSVSATTRLPRLGDVPGESYHFLDDQEFDELARNGGFLEWATIHGRRYGTLVSEVQRILDAGQDLILEIDVQGNDLVKSKMPEAVSIFIVPPSLDELKRRLNQRGTEDPASIAQRLKAAEVELQARSRYNVIIVNDDLATATDELVAFIERYRAEGP
ncbi:MAG: guanylate kinase [Coriobacteriales bacterium]|jgi:guanylate kinase|nr:guanylate kinase [Coriobacteriales bacterium]